jgi:hypothetical protein
MKLNWNTLLDVWVLVALPVVIYSTDNVWVKVAFAFMFGALVTLMIVNRSLDAMNARIQKDIEKYEKQFDV